MYKTGHPVCIHKHIKYTSRSKKIKAALMWFAYIDSICCVYLSLVQVSA